MFRRNYRNFISILMLFRVLRLRERLDWNCYRSLIIGLMIGWWGNWWGDVRGWGVWMLGIIGLRKLEALWQAWRSLPRSWSCLLLRIIPFPCWRFIGSILPRRLGWSFLMVRSMLSRNRLRKLCRKLRKKKRRKRKMRKKMQKRTLKRVERPNKSPYKSKRRLKSKYSRPKLKRNKISNKSD